MIEKWYGTFAGQTELSAYKFQERKFRAVAKKDNNTPCNYA